MPQNPAHSGGRFTPALLLLFVGSGCAAMIYEVVWFHLLRLVIGASAVSIAVLLASFMGGMCIGSLGFSYIVPPRAHPLRVYGVLELVIGVMGVALLYFMPLVNEVYLTWLGYGLGDVYLRGFVCVIALLPPTVCMGATLPAISRWMENTAVGISRMGFFYGANIFGAVVGTAAAGFYLLRVFDVQIATLVALTINLAVAAVAIAMATRAPYSPPAVKKEPALQVKPAFPSMYLVIALSGVTGLGAEVVWTRQLSLLFGATVYTFSLILAVYLAGLGVGSSLGSWAARYLPDGRFALGLCQAFLVLTIPWAAVATVHLIPYMGQHEYVSSPGDQNLIRVYIIDVFRCAIAILPSTLFWGASFPLALAAVGPRGHDPGRLVGGMYGANTVGAIIGAGAFSLGAIAAIGSQGSQQLLAAIAAASTLIVFGSLVRTASVKKVVELIPQWRVSTGALTLAGAALGFIMLLGIIAVPRTPAGLIAYGRHVDQWNFYEDVLFREEGMNASVAVTELEGGERRFHVAGKVVASNGINDMRVERVLGALPLLLHPNPKSVLIVGCGAGITAGTFVMADSIERIVICEIEPAVIDGAREHFARENYRVLKDPRTEIIVDDGRHYLATTDESFDIISSDPIHPWARGVAALYSLEYYQLVRDRLNEGGLVTQWMPLYETSEAAVKSGIATFMKAFPYGTLWNTEVTRGGYDLVMLGQEGELTVDLQALRRRFDSMPPVASALAEIGFTSHVDLLGTYAGQGPDLGPYMADAALNRDHSLKLQYLAGAALDVDYRSEIFDGIAEYLQYPENIFGEVEFTEEIPTDSISD